MPKINDPSELQGWIDNTEAILADMKAKAEVKEKEIETFKEEVSKKDEAIKNLQKEVSDLGNIVIIRKGSWKETDEQKRWDYELGKWWARFRKSFGQGSSTALRNLRGLNLEKVAPSYEKADLGTPLNLGALISNDRMNCRLIRGKLSLLKDMLIPSKAKAMCRDFTPAILN